MTNCKNCTKGFCLRRKLKNRIIQHIPICWTLLPYLENTGPYRVMTRRRPGPLACSIRGNHSEDPLTLGECHAWARQSPNALLQALDLQCKYASVCSKHQQKMPLLATFSQLEHFQALNGRADENEETLIPSENWQRKKKDCTCLRYHHQQNK